MRTATAVESCRVERWRGYVTSTFYAVTDGGYVIAESKSFRWRRSAPPPDRGRARGAYDELVERLAAEGWEPSGEPGREWYRTRFVRASSVPVAVQARPTIVRPRAEQPRPDPGQRPVLGGG